MGTKQPFPADRTGEVVMVGDTMETDILGAVQMGYRSVLVLSGGTRRQDLKKFAYQPDLIVDHVGLIPDEFIFENLAVLAQ